MGEIRWGELKNARLKKVRGASFGEVLSGVIIGIKKHPGRDNQNILFILYRNQIWMVPYVTDDGGNIFLKTMFPSSKYTKLFKESKI
jgi:hypothetical protein